MFIIDFVLYLFEILNIFKINLIIINKLILVSGYKRYVR